MTGFFENSAVFGTIPVFGQSHEVFVTKYNPAGNTIWARSAGFTGIDQGRAINVNANGNIHILGYFSGTKSVFNTTSLLTCDSSAAGADQAFIAKISSGEVVGLTELTTNDNLSFFPNPAVDETVFRSYKPLSKAEMFIYNSIGQLIKNVTDISGTEYKLDLGNLARGVYFVSLKQDNKILRSGKLILTD